MRTNEQVIAHSIVVTDHDLRRLRPVIDHSDTLAAQLLDEELERATVVDQHSTPPDVVTMNSEVVYEDLTTGTRRTVRLVFPNDADASRHWISVLAPIGSALLGLRVNQQIEWPLPAGPRQIVVREIRYQPEASGDFHL